MIIHNDKQYATRNREFVDSIFEFGGSLNLLYKIRKTDKGVLYYTDKDNGFIQYHNGTQQEFTRKSNGHLLFLD